jgi:hypothetical protein
MRRSALIVGLIAVAAVLHSHTRASAAALMPRLSCTDYNKRYPHGVGRPLARDKVGPGNDPVRNFRRSNWLPPNCDVLGTRDSTAISIGSPARSTEIEGPR